MNSLFTPDQIQDLREEFIEFEINEMSREEMASFIRNQKLKEYNLYDENMLRQEIDELMKTCTKCLHLMYLMKRAHMKLCKNLLLIGGNSSNET